MDMVVTNQVSLTIIGDEDSLITLKKSNDLDFSNAEDTYINDGDLIKNYSLEDKAFFKLIVE